ncbi:MAG: pyridoxamine kinase [Suipraeoptans sp.]
MTKKIAVINDLSGFGRCSLVAAISVISSMGASAYPLPTAILTSQTGYDSYFCDDYTDKMDIFIDEWKKLNPHFDGIYTGFLASEKQVDKILKFLSVFMKKDTFLLVDPVMGDDGVTHGLFSDALRIELVELCKMATIITPNLTELCLLTGSDFDSLNEISNSSAKINKIKETAKSLCNNSNKHVIVTGIRIENEVGIAHMGNLHVTSESFAFFSFPYVGKSYSGTGDLFASCIAGGIAKGKSVDECIRVAGDFIYHSLEDSTQENIPGNDGVNFENHLHLLT